MRKINGKPKSNEPTSCQLSSQCVYPIVNACSAALRSKIDSIFCGRTRKKPKKRRRRRSIAENFSAAVAIVASIAVAQT